MTCRVGRDAARHGERDHHHRAAPEGGGESDLRGGRLGRARMRPRRRPSGRGQPARARLPRRRHDPRLHHQSRRRRTEPEHQTPRGRGRQRLDARLRRRARPRPDGRARRPGPGHRPGQGERLLHPGAAQRPPYRPHRPLGRAVRGAGPRLASTWSTSISDPVVAPYGGRAARLVTNPVLGRHSAQGAAARSSWTSPPASSPWARCAWPTTRACRSSGRRPARPRRRADDRSRRACSRSRAAPSCPSATTRAGAWRWPAS